VGQLLQLLTSLMDKKAERIPVGMARSVPEAPKVASYLPLEQPVDEGNVQLLTEMGFTRAQAESALRKLLSSLSSLLFVTRPLTSLMKSPRYPDISRAANYLFDQGVQPNLQKGEEKAENEKKEVSGSSKPYRVSDQYLANFLDSIQDEIAAQVPFFSFSFSLPSMNSKLDRFGTETTINLNNSLSRTPQSQFRRKRQVPPNRALPLLHLPPPPPPPNLPTRDP